jgi:hypothetical protein
MMRRSLLVTLAVLLGCVWSVKAAKVKVWHHSGSSHHDKAQFKGTVVTSEGTLRLSRRLKPFANVDATHVWDIVEDKQGNLLVATGDEGKIYKVTPEGKVSVAYDSQDSQILCLLAGPDGTTYAGTGPGGRILAITPDGNTRVLYASPESYVWSMALDASGEAIYAGTGPKGRIYRVTRQGKANVFYATKQEHVLSLTVGPDGALYAGTDKNGLVYRFDSTGKGFVLYHAAQAEVRSLLLAPDGLYAGTSSPRRHGIATSSTALEKSSPSQMTAVLTSATKLAGKSLQSPPRAPVSTSTSSSQRDKDEHTSDSGSPSAPRSGENSLYRIGADGSVREVFREKALILCLLRQHGRLLVGTGMEGQLFEVDEATKEYCEIARLDNGQIHCMCRRRDGSIVLGTGDPGKLYVLQDQYVASGTVTSEVLDAKLISKWGSLRWKGDVPAGTRLTVAVRSGNLDEPDETWSDWSAEQSDAERATAIAPAARFLQYRVSLHTENPAVTPALRSLAVRYMTLNQAPEVTSIEVPDLNASNLDNPKKLHFKWTATDPNEDELTYNVFIRKEGWKNWVQVEENLEKKECDWDATTAPSGIYQLKVVASDRKDNPAEDALTGERISESFAVAHAPPTVSLKVAGMEGDQALIEATATDPLVRLTAASFAVNGKKWINVFPTDGLFDSKTETFRFKTESLKPGTYVVVLRVRDAAGNMGSDDVVFTVQTRQAHGQ